MWPLLQRDGVALQYAVLSAMWTWAVGGWAWWTAPRARPASSARAGSSVGSEPDGAVSARLFYASLVRPPARALSRASPVSGTPLTPSLPVCAACVRLVGHPPRVRARRPAPRVQARPARRPQRPVRVCVFLAGVGRRRRPGRARGMGAARRRVRWRGEEDPQGDLDERGARATSFEAADAKTAGRGPAGLSAAGAPWRPRFSS